MNIRYRSEAVADMTTAAARMNRDRHGRGDRFVSAVDRIARLLTVHPRVYARVGRGVAGREVRLAPVARYPYLVYYEVTATEIVLLSIGHARMRRHPWRRRLGP